MRQGFYYEMRQFYYKMWQLLQNATFITNCDSTYLYNKPIVKRELFTLLSSFDDLILVKFALTELQNSTKHYIFFELDYAVSFFDKHWLVEALKRICLNNIQTVFYIELILLFYELTCYKKRRAIEDITKGKLESFLENFTAIFGVISYIV